jgi:general secretion pathway protein K
MMKRIVKNERGIALYLVLWVMALLTVIAGEFCHAIRTEVNITRNFKEETETGYIAKAGVFWAIGELIVDELIRRPGQIAGNAEEPEDIRWRFNVDIPAVPFGSGHFKVEKENESGKVNLNRAGQPLLKMMLSTFEMDDETRDIIVDSILDWRDKDGLRHAGGAENEYYLSLPEPYRCRNNDFTTIEELLLVRGVTPEIFYGGLREMVSVYQEKEKPVEKDKPRRDEADFHRININAASPRMLRSLPGMTEEMALKITAYREKKDLRTLPEVFSLVGSDIYMAIASYITLKPSPYYTIRSTGLLPDSRTRQGVQAVVKIDREREKRYEIIQWIDSLEYGS